LESLEKTTGGAVLAAYFVIGRAGALSASPSASLARRGIACQWPPAEVRNQLRNSRISRRRNLSSGARWCEYATGRRCPLATSRAPRAWPVGMRTASSRLTARHDVGDGGYLARCRVDGDLTSPTPQALCPWLFDSPSGAKLTPQIEATKPNAPK